MSFRICLILVGLWSVLALAVELPRTPERATVALPNFSQEVLAFEREPVDWLGRVVNAGWGGGRGGPERIGGWLDQNWLLVDYLDRSADYTSHEWLKHRGIRAEVYGSNEYQETIHFHEEGAKKLFWDNGIARDFMGERVLSEHYNLKVESWAKTQGFDAFIVCNNAPRWWSVINYDLLTSPLLGDATSQDNIGGPLNRIGAGSHGRYCDSCNAKFFHHLEATGRLPEFRARYKHIRDYVQEHLGPLFRQLPPSVKHAYDRAEGERIAQICHDPVMAEYMKFLHLCHLHSFSQYYRDNHLVATRQGKPYSVHGNQGGSFIGPAAYQIVLSDFVDTVWFETSGISAYDIFKFRWNNAWGALSFQMGRAMAGGQRPFMRMTRFQKHTPDMVEHEMAEECAGGGVLFVNQAHFEKEPPLADLVRQYYAFRQERRALFTDEGKRRVAEVALAYSVPTMLYRGYHYTADAPPHNSFSGMARALEEGHLPYEVVILNHPELRRDHVTLDKLRRYRLLILPALECLSDAQVELVGKYLDAGGAVGLLGESGLRDENNQPRKSPPTESWKKRGRVVDLLDGDAFLACRATESEATRRLTEKAIAATRKALNDDLVLQGDLPRMLWVKTWEHFGEFVSLHFVNYDVNFESGSATPTQPTRVSFRMPQGVPAEEAAFLTPDGGSTPLPFTSRSGRIEATLPSIRVYGIVVIGRRGLDAARSALLRGDAWLDRARFASQEAATQAEAVRKLRSPESASAYAQAAQQLLQRVAEREDKRYFERVKTMANTDGAVLALDFGGKQAQAPWQLVAADSDYTAERRFGWLPPHDASEPTPEELYYAMARRFPDGSDREIKARSLLFWPYRELPPEPLRMSLCCGTPRRFQMDLADGLYEVRVVTVNPSWILRNYLVSGMVWCNGHAVGLDTALDKGSFASGTFTAEARGGKIELTFGGSTGWAVAAIVVRPAQKPTSAPLADGSLREWRVSPRYANPDWHPIRQTRCPPEAKLAAPAPDGWTIVKAPPAGIGLVDLGSNRDAAIGDIVYAATTIASDRGRTAKLRLGSSSSAVAWLNGQEVAYLPNVKGVQRDEFVGEVSLKAGRNVLVLKLQRFWERRWLFYASLTD